MSDDQRNAEPTDPTRPYAEPVEPTEPTRPDQPPTMAGQPAYPGGPLVPAGSPPGEAPTDPWHESGYPAVAPPVPEVGSPRRFPRWLIPAAAATAVLAVVAFVAALMVPRAGGGPLEFEPFDEVGTMALGEELSAEGIRLDGDTAYVAASDGTGVVLTAADHPSGDQRWQEPVRGLTGLSQVAVMDGRVLVIGDDPTDVSAPVALVVLDAGTGQERGRIRYPDGDDLFYSDGTVALADRAGSRLVGLDPGSNGDELWEVPFPGGDAAEVVPVVVEDDLAGPSGFTFPFTTPMNGDRLVMIGEDRSVQVIDVHDGEVAAEHPNVADPGDHVAAYQDRLFVAPDEGGYQLRAHDLGNLDAQPQVLATAPDPQQRPGLLTPCGEGRLCLVESDGDTSTVVVADAAAGGAARSPELEASVDTLLPVGQSLMVVSRDAGTVIVGSDGQPVGEPRPVAPARIDADNALFFSGGWGTIGGEASVAGFAVETGERTELGLIRDVAGEWCSWDDRYLACPTGEGATVWQFAG